MKTKKNIILIGLMGAGKTTIGRLLASKLQYNFIDIDDLIEEKEKITISEIFASKGEPYFRELETSILKEYCTKNGQVISTGGGAPQKPENLKLMKNSGTIIYLYAPSDILYKRLLNEIDKRPMLHKENPKQRLQELLDKREPFYNMADYKIDTTHKDLEEIVTSIISLFNGS
jgi:shikimate kinase